VSAAGRRLERAFYERPTIHVARELLGQTLVRFWKGKRFAGRIVETEAYIGEADTACHASRGLTARNAVMFGPPGHAYVYFTYGMHWMLNVVTEREGFPAAVLIRAVEPIEGIEAIRRRRRGRSDRELTSGPARLCTAFAIDRTLNGADLVDGPDLMIEPGPMSAVDAIASGPRVGIDYAAPEDRDAPWRFWIGGNRWVSRGGRSAGAEGPPGRRLGRQKTTKSPK